MVLAAALAAASSTASAIPLHNEILSYDWISLGDAAGLGLVGGAVALVVALATDKRVVGEVVREGIRNVIVAPLAGVGAYLLIESAVSLDWVSDLPPVTRFVIIAAAGWAGIGFFVWLRGLAAQAAVAVAEWSIGKLK